MRKPFPDWVEYRPDQIWIYDTTHFTRAGMAVTIVEDLVSRKWIADIVSAEETSTQVEIVFTDALAAEGLLAVVEARADTPVDPDTDDDRLSILLAVSDNGSQMTSISTRKFMAGVPGRPTRVAMRTLTSRPSPTPPSCEPSSPSSGPATTPSGSTPGSATSPPTTNTPDVVPPSQSPRSRPRNRTPPTPRLPSQPTPAAPQPETPR